MTYVLHFVGGGQDLACEDCLDDAKEERPRALVRVEPTPDGFLGEFCSYCGRQLW